MKWRPGNSLIALKRELSPLTQQHEARRTLRGSPHSHPARHVSSGGPAPVHRVRSSVYVVSDPHTYPKRSALSSPFFRCKPRSSEGRSNQAEITVRKQTHRFEPRASRLPDQTPPRATASAPPSAARENKLFTCRTFHHDDIARTPGPKPGQDLLL